MVRVQKTQIYKIADLLLREECVFLTAVSNDHMKDTSCFLSQCLWNASTHCKFLFVCDDVFLILVPLIVILSPAKTAFICERHLWKTLKARTAFFLTDSYLLYIVSSVSQSWLIFFAYISLFQLAWLSAAVLLNVGIQWFLVCLLTQLAFFSGTSVFFKLFELDFFSRAGNIIEDTNQEKKIIFTFCLYSMKVSILKLLSRKTVCEK